MEGETSQKFINADMGYIVRDMGEFFNFFGVDAVLMCYFGDLLASCYWSCIAFFCLAVDCALTCARKEKPQEQ